MWTYMVTDWRTGAVVYDESAPIVCDSFSDGLGVAQGTLNGSIPLADLAVPVDEILLPWRRVIWPCWNGRPFGAYVVTAKSPFGPKDTAVGFVAARVDEIFKHRHIWSTLVFVQQDQLDIARNLMGYAIGMSSLGAVAPGYLAIMEALPVAATVPWMAFDTALSGVLRDRLDDQDGYQAARDLKVADALTSLAQVVDGFEYRLDYRRDVVTGLPSVLVRLGYPNLGRTYPVIPLEYPGNVTTWTEAEDTADTETMTRIFGAGQGVERPAGTPAVDDAAHAQGWPLLMGGDSSQASDAATLAAQAAARLSAHWRVNEGWTFQLPESVVNPDGSTRDVIGSYDLGDVVQRAVEHPRWGKRRGYLRIVGHKIQPSRPGRAGSIIPSVLEVL